MKHLFNTACGFLVSTALASLTDPIHGIGISVNNVFGIESNAFNGTASNSAASVSQKLYGFKPGYFAVVEGKNHAWRVNMGWQHGSHTKGYDWIDTYSDLEGNLYTIRNMKTTLNVYEIQAAFAMSRMQSFSIMPGVSFSHLQLGESGDVTRQNSTSSNIETDVTKNRWSVFTNIVYHYSKHIDAQMTFPIVEIAMRGQARVQEGWWGANFSYIYIEDIKSRKVNWLGIPTLGLTYYFN